MNNFLDLLATEQWLDITINGRYIRAGLHDHLTFDQNDTVTVDGYHILPRFRHLAVNGVLKLQKPFYCWYHTASDQGWLLIPQISNTNDDH